MGDGIKRSEGESVAELEMLLEWHFGAKVEVKQFRGSWVDIPELLRTRLGMANTKLGDDTIVGEMVFHSYRKVAS